MGCEETDDLARRRLEERNRVHVEMATGTCIVGFAGAGSPLVLDDVAGCSRVLEPAGQRVPVRGRMPIVLRAHFVSDNFQATRSTVYLDDARSRSGARGRPEHEVRVSMRIPALVVH